MEGICKGGKITLKIFTNIMDSVYYIEILNSKLSEIKKVAGKDKKLMFYNNPKYKYNWDRNEKKYKLYQLAPYSPELNQIENIWLIMARKIRSKDIMT